MTDFLLGPSESVWPTATCCGEPRVSPEVDACYDHATLCCSCRTNPAEGGERCPWCRSGVRR